MMINSLEEECCCKIDLTIELLFQSMASKSFEKRRLSRNISSILDQMTVPEIIQLVSHVRLRKFFESARNINLDTSVESFTLLFIRMITLRGVLRSSMFDENPLYALFVENGCLQNFHFLLKREAVSQSQLSIVAHIVSFLEKGRHQLIGIKKKFVQILLKPIECKSDSLDHQFLIAQSLLALRCLVGKDQNFCGFRGITDILYPFLETSCNSYSKFKYQHSNLTQASSLFTESHSYSDTDKAVESISSQFGLKGKISNNYWLNSCIKLHILNEALFILSSLYFCRSNECRAKDQWNALAITTASLIMNNLFLLEKESKAIFFSSSQTKNDSMTTEIATDSFQKDLKFDERGDAFDDEMIFFTDKEDIPILPTEFLLRPTFSYPPQLHPPFSSFSSYQILYGCVTSLINCMSISHTFATQLFRQCPKIIIQILRLIRFHTSAFHFSTHHLVLQTRIQIADLSHLSLRFILECVTRLPISALDSLSSEGFVPVVIENLCAINEENAEILETEILIVFCLLTKAYLGGNSELAGQLMRNQENECHVEDEIEDDDESAESSDKYNTNNLQFEDAKYGIMPHEKRLIKEMPEIYNRESQKQGLLHTTRRGVSQQSSFFTIKRSRSPPAIGTRKSRSDMQISSECMHHLPSSDIFVPDVEIDSPKEMSKTVQCVLQMLEEEGGDDFLFAHINSGVSDRISDKAVRILSLIGHPQWHITYIQFDDDYWKPT